MLQPRKLVLDRLMLNPKFAQRAAQLLVLRAKPRHFMDQIAHHADQVVMRKTLKRIRDARRHTKLESQFVRPDSPLRSEICPGYDPTGGGPIRCKSTLH
jgi:hypothetical protein